VRHIVQTHLDLDHVGGLSDFPWAKVHVHAAELDAATARKGAKARGRYRPPMWAHRPDWVTYATEGEPWAGLAAIRDLKSLPEQILLLSLPGHTHGHCGVAVETESGWLLDAGDAYFDAREVHQPNPQVGFRVGLFERIVTTDKQLRIRNQHRLRQLLATHREATVFAAHDLGGFPASTG
jgi:glyoxylase-like metal-dependent hydrolase (beta-lactamase superfamily II)